MSWLHSAPAAAPVPVARPSFTPELEHRARVNGFHNAEQMMLWSQQRNMHTGGTVDARTLPSVAAATAWHPANILAYVSDAMKNARGD